MSFRKVCQEATTKVSLVAVATVLIFAAVPAYPSGECDEGECCGSCTGVAGCSGAFLVNPDAHPAQWLFDVCYSEAFCDGEETPLRFEFRTIPCHLSISEQECAEDCNFAAMDCRESCEDAIAGCDVIGNSQCLMDCEMQESACEADCIECWHDDVPGHDQPEI